MNITTQGRDENGEWEEARLTVRNDRFIIHTSDEDDYPHLDVRVVDGELVVNFSSMRGEKIAVMPRASNEFAIRFVEER